MDKHIPIADIFSTSVARIDSVLGVWDNENCKEAHPVIINNIDPAIISVLLIVSVLIILKYIQTFTRRNDKKETIEKNERWNERRKRDH